METCLYDKSCWLFALHYDISSQNLIDHALDTLMPVLVHALLKTNETNPRPVVREDSLSVFALCSAVFWNCSKICANRVLRSLASGFLVHFCWMHGNGIWGNDSAVMSMSALSLYVTRLSGFLFFCEADMAITV